MSEIYLFTSQRLSGVLQDLFIQASADLEQMDAGVLLASSPESIVEGLIAEAAFQVPVLEESSIEITHSELREAPAGVRPIEFVFHVPFQGNASIFTLAPSKSIMTPPLAKVLSDELQIVFRALNPDPNLIKPQFDRTLSHIKTHLGWIADDLKVELPKLTHNVTSAVEKRQDRLKQAGQAAPRASVIHCVSEVTLQG